MNQPKGCSQSALLCECCPPAEEYALKSSLLPAWWVQLYPEQDCTAMAAVLPSGVPMLMTLLDRCAVSPETAHTVIRAPALCCKRGCTGLQVPIFQHLRSLLGAQMMWWVLAEQSALCIRREDQRQNTVQMRGMQGRWKERILPREEANNAEKRLAKHVSDSTLAWCMRGVSQLTCKPCRCTSEF